MLTHVRGKPRELPRRVLGPAALPGEADVVSPQNRMRMQDREVRITRAPGLGLPAFAPEPDRFAPETRAPMQQRTASQPPGSASNRKHRRDTAQDHKARGLSQSVPGPA